MAVAAARNALGTDPGPDEVWLASTTAPFIDRSNAGIISAAIGCSENVSTTDLGGSQRCATGALLTALRQSGQRKILVTTAEKRKARVGTPQELSIGDGSAAFLVGQGEGIAELVSSAQRSVDFLDHFKASGRDFDYVWEERWLRDEGFQRLIPDVVKEALQAADLASTDIDHFVLPISSRPAVLAVAGRLGIPEEKLAEPFDERFGNTGSSHALVMLAAVLEKAQHGQLVALVGFGQGVDVLLLRVGASANGWRSSDTLDRQIARGIETDNYNRYLTLNNLIDRDLGIRAEVDLPSAPTIMYRNRDALLGFHGGRCRACGSVQFPRQSYCQEPSCGAYETQEPFRLADVGASLQSYTADHLIFSPDPPARYGMVKFDSGGSLMMDITDAQSDEIFAGARLRMAFRIRDIDGKRGNKRYFWKAVPAI